MVERAELSEVHMDPMSTGACGKAALPLKERNVILPPGSEMTNTKASLPIYSQSQ